MKRVMCFSLLAFLIWSCDSNRPSSILESNPDESEGLAKADGNTGYRYKSVKVMTWNVYVGADLDKLLEASSPEEIPVLAAQAFQMLLATNFHERADAIADQIGLFKPHLIGLQEISLVRIQSPGDAVAGGTIPAEDVLLDYLQILMDALEARDLRYYMAGVVANTDAEVPMVTSPTPTFDDVRLTDFDVVLAREDVKTDDVEEVNYAATLSIPEVGLEVVRGYVSLDARVAGKKIRFINTHLEPFGEGLTEPIQLAQAEELIFAHAGETKPLILVGDLNTRPPDANTYQLLVNSGYRDLWLRNQLHDNPDGFTSSFGLDLMSTEPPNQRIDLIMMDPRSDANMRVAAEVVGDEEEDKTASGLWPSDHAGVVAQIKFRFQYLADN